MKKYVLFDVTKTDTFIETFDDIEAAINRADNVWSYVQRFRSVSISVRTIYVDFD